MGEFQAVDLDAVLDQFEHNEEEKSRHEPKSKAGDGATTIKAANRDADASVAAETSRRVAVVTPPSDDACPREQVRRHVTDDSTFPCIHFKALGFLKYTQYARGEFF
jgi:hypothetical protein